MGLFDHFPYTNVHELNLDWVLSMMKALEAKWDAFTAGNSLQFADPMLHDISKTYAKNTIVLDGNGNAYVSLLAVPVGVALSNQDYWLMVFDYEAFIEKVNKNFTSRYYRDQYRATAAMAIGDWLTVDDVLCKATAAIAVDDVLEVGVNIEHFTLEDFIKAFMTSANQMIQQYKNDIDASELAYRQQLAQDIADTTASLQAQLDAAISGATADSEVINARVGWNGITYTTLGDALREQAGSASGYSSFKIFDKATDWTLGRIDSSTGAIVTSTKNIYSCFINCQKDYHLTIRSKTPSAYYFGVFAYNQDGSYVGLSKDVSGRYFDSRYAQGTHPGTENMLYRIDMRQQPEATITDIEDLISNYEITISKNIDTVAMDYDIPISSWTRGSLDATTGAEISTTTSMRTDFIKFPATGKFKISVDAGYYFAVFKYDEDETFVSVDHTYGSGDFVCVDTTSLYRVVLRNEPATTNSRRISQIEQIRSIYFTLYVEDIDSILNNKIVKNSTWIDTINTEHLSNSDMWSLGRLDASTGVETHSGNTMRSFMIKLYSNEVLEVINSDPNVITLAIFRYNTDGSFESVIKSYDNYGYYTENTNYLYRICCRYQDSRPITDKSELLNYLSVNIYRTEPRKLFEYDSILKYKRWIVCGDSFTHGDFTSAPDPTATVLDDGLYVGQNAVYPFYIGNRTGAIVEQYAVNGMSLADTGSNSFTNIYQKIPADADYITMYFGINDKIAGVAIGDADSTDITEFNGAWNVILTWLRNNRPFAHVGIIISNSAGSSAIPYVNATRDMAIKYGYSYLDMQKDDSLPAMAFEQQRDLDPTIASLIESQFAVNLLASNAHPNEKAHLYESYFIEDWLHKL